MRPLLAPLVMLEAFLLALVAAAPLGGVSQTISPLARAWPWLLAPARAVFGAAAVDVSVPPERGWPALALFALLLIGASLTAAFALTRARGADAAGRRHLALALGGAAALGLTCVLLPSLPSDDVFSYILYGRIAVIHHANPLVAAPSSFSGDPFLSLAFWRGTRSVYGPAWLLLSSGVTLLAQGLGGALATYVLLFKLLGLAAHLANAALIWGILSRLAPRRRLFGMLLYAWNPLCLLEFCASAHNDAVLLTFALLGIYWLVCGHELPALVAFGLSIATKYVLLAVLPFYLVLVFRQRHRHGEPPRRIVGALCWRLGVVLGVVALTALPYWDGPQTFSAIFASPPAQQLDNSLLEVAQWPLRALVGAFGIASGSVAAGVQASLRVVGALLFLAIWLRQLRQATSLEGMLAAWVWALFAYVVFASGWFWPWYVTWVVVLVALLPEGELTVAALLLACGALTLYAFLPLYAAGVYGLRAFLVFGPALAYLAVLRLHPRTHLLRLPARGTLSVRAGLFGWGAPRVQASSKHRVQS